MGRGDDMRYDGNMRHGAEITICCWHAMARMRHGMRSRTDDGGAEMADMHLLGDVGRRKVDDHRL